MAIAFVQSATGGTTTWVTGLTVTAGNYLIITQAGQSPVGGGTSSISDNLGTVYTQLGNFYESGYASRTSQIYMWGGVVPSTGALTITQAGTFGVTLSPNDAAGGQLYATEFSGVNITTPISHTITNYQPTNSSDEIDWVYNNGTTLCQMPTIGFVFGAAAQIWYNVGSWWTIVPQFVVSSLTYGSAIAYNINADSISFSNNAGGPVLGMAVQLNPAIAATSIATPENYYNGLGCVTTATLDTTTGIVPVSMVAPAASGFRIAIDSEMMLVIGGGTTLTWTVQRAIEGSTATTHNSNATVFTIWSAGAWDEIRKERAQCGPVFPSCPKVGDYFVLTGDSTFQWGTPFYYTGTIWQSLSPGINSAPVPTSWDDEFNKSTLDLKWTVYDPSIISPLSAPTVVKSMNNSWFTMSCIGSGVQQRVYGYMQPVPSGVWTFRSKIAMDGPTRQYYGNGMYVYAVSVGRTVMGFNSYYGSQSGTFYIIRATNGSYSSEVDCYNNDAFMWYQEVQYDGTYIYFRCSITGANYTTFWTETQSSFLAAPITHIGIGMHPYGDGSGNPRIGMTASYDWFRRTG
jgi:hypothetical protein